MEIARALKMFKRNCALGFVFGILSSVYGAITVSKPSSESKPILYLDMVYCKFLLDVSVEIDPFRCEQMSVI